MKIFRLIGFFIIVGLLSCNENLQVTELSSSRIAINDSISIHPDIEQMISPYRNAIQSEMQKPLAYNVNSMFKTDTPYNTAIGNLIADAVMELSDPIFKTRHAKSIDAVLLNYGGIRAGISQGTITTRTAYDIMPFENMVVVVELSAEQMERLLDYLAKSNKAHPIANMTLELNHANEFNKILINGKKFDADKTYHVATSDYLAEGGDNMDFFLNSKTIYHLDYKIRNLLIDYFVKNDTINYTSDQRFTNID